MWSEDQRDILNLTWKRSTIVKHGSKKDPLNLHVHIYMYLCNYVDISDLLF